MRATASLLFLVALFSTTSVRCTRSSPSPPRPPVPTGERQAGQQDPLRVDPDRQRLPRSTLEQAREEMTVREIVTLLGPAHGDAGSGIYRFVWQCSDGSSLIVGFVDPNKKPFYIKWLNDER